MAALELRRLREIERRETRLKRRHQTVYDRWARINKERMDLQFELRRLAEERDTLQQGQLIFPEPPAPLLGPGDDDSSST